MPKADSNAGNIIDEQRPFPGLQSFQEKNKSQFGGRDIEVRELVELVENSGLTTVFGKSGIGKTSVLLAGLIPELHQNFYFPIYIRIDFSSVKPPLQQVKDIIHEKLVGRDKEIPSFQDQTLWAYFHSFKLLDGMVTPVIIFDQFEELFTLGKNKIDEANELITEIADLAENRVPLVVQQDYQQRTDMMPSHFGEQHYRVVISLREDYLAQLESLKNQIPSIRNSRYRLVQMTVSQALDAAMKPGKGLIDREVAIAIIRKIPGVQDRDFDSTAEDPNSGKRLLVEPFLLSLICYQINEKRIEQQLPVFTKALVDSFNITDVIESYYEGTIQTLPGNIGIAIENELLTETGYRKLETTELLEKEYGMTESVIIELTNKRIIRKEERDGVEYVELIHDVLAPVIKAKRDKRLIYIREKEKEEAVQKAIFEEREKIKARRTRLRRWIQTIAVFMLAVIGTMWYYGYTNAKEANRLTQQKFAHKVLLTGEYIANEFGELEQASLFARSAYLIYKENKGDDINPFYHGMYESITENLGVDYVFTEDTTGAEIRTMALSDGMVYVSTGEGEISGTPWNSLKHEKQYPTTLYTQSSKNKITGITISPDKRYLAFVDSSRFVSVLPLPLFLSRPTLFKLPENGEKKIVHFINSTQFIVSSTKGLTVWDITKKEKPISWQPRKVVLQNLDNEAPPPVDIQWDEPMLKMKNYNSYPMHAVNGSIVVGLNQAVLIFKKDSVIHINSRELGRITSIQFDQVSNYIYTGSDNGSICKIGLKPLTIEKKQDVGSSIKSVLISSNGRYIAAITVGKSGENEYILVYDLLKAKHLKDIVPLILKRQDACDEKIYCTLFTSDNRYLLGSYNSGEVYKWPLDADLLSRTICEKVRTVDTLFQIRASFDSIWTTHFKKQLSNTEISTYSCSN